MSPSRRLILFLLWTLMNSTCRSDPTFCNHSGDEPNSSLAFRDAENRTVIECAKESLYLTCCLNGVPADTIFTWEKFNEGTGSWESADEGVRRYPVGQGIMEGFLILNSDKRKDVGLYRCSAKQINSNPLVSISRMITLKLYECPTISSDKPYIVLPYSDDDPNPKIVYKRRPGQSWNITCAGFFSDPVGCEKYGTCLVLWESGRQPIMEKEGRLTIKDTQVMPSGRGRGQILIISKIEKSDFKRYNCTLATTANTNRREVSLEEGDEIPEHFKAPMISLAVVIVLLFVFAVGIYIWRDYLFLIWKDHIKSRKKSDKSHHMFILYDDESDKDKGLVKNHLVPKLRKELRYKVALIDELPERFGRSNFSLYDTASSTSECMVVVISEDFMSNEVLKTCLHDACIDHYRDLTFISYKDTPNMLSDLQVGDQIHVASRLAHKIKWPGVESPRRLRNFWIKFRRQLPPLPKVFSEETNSAAIETRDLLQSTGSSCPGGDSFNGTIIRSDENEDDVFGDEIASGGLKPVLKTSMSADSGRGMSLSTSI